MPFKRAIVRQLVDWIAGWNSEIHQAIEDKIYEEDLRMFPPRGDDDLSRREKRKSDMRTFYYTRMSTTASLLMAGAAFVVALIALVLTVIPLLH